MRIFLFEFVTGGGFLSIAGSPLPEGDLLAEGEAMWRAIHEDLSAIKGVEVHSTRDQRLPTVDVDHLTPVSAHAREAFLGLALSCDFSLVIAPEFDSQLLTYVSGVESFGGKLLSPNSQFIKIASNKTETADALTAHGVPIPQGQLLEAGGRVPDDFPLPAVLKVNDGAGSMANFIDSRDTRPPPDQKGAMRIEQFVQGTACSVSFLCRERDEPIACPPMRQILTGNQDFGYLGGERLMDLDQVQRATQLGQRALATLPRTQGYVGVDIVLGNELDGTNDYVIEVNPRLTTSYVGLREIADTNLAKAMVDIVRGIEPDVTFSDRSVSFSADGCLR